MKEFMNERGKEISECIDVLWVTETLKGDTILLLIEN